MATIVFTALGTALGGPLGGAIGGLLGNQIDQAVIGGSNREGPRLKELAVSTSSYGTAIPRHFGRIRAAGSIIWATDLIESKEKSGGKGRPSVTSFSYSANFAVALASRPIASLGRIWADGNLLRGAQGDLKVGGELRIYNGHGDQPIDPLIASDQGAACPAFRGHAYCVFEALELGDFGNRLPGLTFEIIADNGEVSLENLIDGIGKPVQTERALANLQGFSEEGGPLAASLAAIDQVYPIVCDASSSILHFSSADELPEDPPLLPEPVADSDGEGFGAASGSANRRQPDSREIPDGLRYYDISRDYQAGMQRADGRAKPGRSRSIEFPGALEAEPARNLINSAAERAGWSKERLSWRIAELDPELSPGKAVRVPRHSGLWMIDSWEWLNAGLELDLRRIPANVSRQLPADSGNTLPVADKIAEPTLITAFELPWDGLGGNNDRRVYVVASAASDGWTGAALYTENSGQLSYIAATGRQRGIMGTTAAALEPANPLLPDHQGRLEVILAADDFGLFDTTAKGLASGDNRALVGNEIIQFSKAVAIGGSHWVLSGLLRGRGGTESAALLSHATGTPFVLLNDNVIALNEDAVGQTPQTQIAALGLADDGPILAPIMNAGLSRRPLTPVHPAITSNTAGDLTMSWTRRARGAWNWPEGLEIPLNEEGETYRVGLGSPDNADVIWQVQQPSLTLSAAQLSGLHAAHPGKSLWVSQTGDFGNSDPLLLHILA